MQRRRFVQHHIYLDIQSVARMVRLEILDPANACRKAHDQIQKYTAIIGAGSCACEMGNVLLGCARPVENDVEGEEQTAGGIEKPNVCKCANCRILVVALFIYLGVDHLTNGNTNQVER
jgi:hypothetical protein